MKARKIRVGIISLKVGSPLRTVCNFLMTFSIVSRLVVCAVEGCAISEQSGVFS